MYFICNVKLIYYRRKDAEDLIKRYFDQVTKGCGKKFCDNEFCASGKLQSSPNKDEAGALALKLLSNRAKLCPLEGDCSLILQKIVIQSAYFMHKCILDCGVFI